MPGDGAVMGEQYDAAELPGPSGAVEYAREGSLNGVSRALRPELDGRAADECRQHNSEEAAETAPKTHHVTSPSDDKNSNGWRLCIGSLDQPRTERVYVDKPVLALPAVLPS